MLMYSEKFDKIFQIRNMKESIFNAFFNNFLRKNLTCFIDTFFRTTPTSASFLQTYISRSYNGRKKVF